MFKTTAGQITSQRLLKAALLTLIACLFPQFSLAQSASSQAECLNDQWVLDVSQVPALRGKAVDAIQEVSSKTLDVVESTARVMLLTTLDGLAPREQMIHGKTIHHSARTDLCGKLRERTRETLRGFRSSGKPGFVRRISCSCNGRIKADDISPNDTWYNQQWGLWNYNRIDIHAQEAWGLSTGSPDTVVAVLDTGVDYTHPDLAANIWQNPSEIPGNGIDDDGDGIVDDVHGMNAITNTGDPMDDHGHGTHTSGTIGAVSNNHTGVAGVNWDIKIMPCKFLDSTGSGDLYNAIKCVDYVTMQKNRGVNIILSSNSWGWGPGFWQPMYEAIARARDAGLLFVAAAGNASNNNDTNPSYPSSFQVANVISVAAVDSNGGLAGFSNYGQNSVHIGAPGVNILSTYKLGNYGVMSGTSMATPHVAGALALLYSYAPWMTWQELKANLLANGTPLASLAGKTITGGFLNAYNMLLAAPPDPNQGNIKNPPRNPNHVNPVPDPTSTPTPLPTPTMTPTPVPGYWAISGTVFGDNVPLGGAQVRLTTANGVFYRYADSHGQYRFDNVLGPTDFALDAIASGFTFQTQGGYFNQDTSVTLNGSSKSYHVSVLVLDASRQPIPGAQVSSGTDSRTTPSTGQVTFNIPYGASYSIAGALPGYTLSSTTLSGVVYGDVARVIVAVPQGQ